MSTVGHSDFSHGIPSDFASRLIRPGTQPRRAGPYETSRGNTCSFPAVPPAHTLLRPGIPSTSFASIVQARHHLDLADRFANLGYGPAVRLKPFRPHLAVGALSCAIQPKRVRHTPTARTRQAAGAHPGGFPTRRPSPAAIEPHLHTDLRLRPSCARRGITPAFGYGPRLGSVRLDFHQLGTRAARRALRGPPTSAGPSAVVLSSFGPPAPRAGTQQISWGKTLRFRRDRVANTPSGTRQEQGIAA